MAIAHAAPVDELRARLEPIVAEDGWVIDGNYASKIGTLVLDAADTIVWLDLAVAPAAPHPPSHQRPRAAVERQQGDLVDGALGRRSLFAYALTQQPKRRREYPIRYAGYPLVRLCSPRDVERWIANVA